MRNKIIKTDTCAIFALNRDRNIYDDYVEDILLPAEKKTFEKHLDICPYCAKQVVEALRREEMVKQLPLLSEIGQKKSLNKKLKYMDEIMQSDVMPQEFVALAASPYRRPDVQGVAYGVAVDRETGQGALLECIAVVSDDVTVRSRLEIRAKEVKAVKTDGLEVKITPPTTILEELLKDMFDMHQFLRSFRLAEKTIRVEVNYKAGSGYLYEADSLALAVLVAIMSAVTGKHVDRDVLFSAGIKLNGYLKSVGDLEQKISIARDQRMNACFLADENRPECSGKTIKKSGVTLHCFSTLEDVLMCLGFIDKVSAEDSERKNAPDTCHTQQKKGGSVMGEPHEEKKDAKDIISMHELSDPNFWASVSDKQTQAVPLVVILPSGRHKDSSSGHLALISDALYTYEVIVEIEKITRQVGLNGINIQSMLDIDYYEIYMSAKNNQNSKEFLDPMSPINSNLLLLATADINIMTEILLNQVKSIETYGVGYTTPYEDCNILGGKGKRYTDRSSTNVGVLAIYTVPWAQTRRISMFCGGIMATGTLAATILLLKYLRGEERANNNYRTDIPLKIVNAELKNYQYSELIDPEMCIPQHKLQNINTNITVIE